MAEQQTQKIVRTIPASFVRTTAVNPLNLIKVAAYARVSTKKDEQEDSYERQVAHYTKYIKNHEGWQFVDIYADEGITGTRADKRVDFQRMMVDCRKGLINKILVKSIARFARNTVDALNSIRELKEIGISVYFENENIDTLSPGGEVLITILAAMAEQESRTISTNIKWAYQKKFQNGDIQLNYKRFLGYTRDENHNLVIVPEQAAIVQRIYREYLYGYSAASIAKHLTDEEILTPSNKTKWYPSVIVSILQNEKYYGALICGKTFKPDVLSKKRYKNEGQVERYYIEKSHPAIVSKEEFDLVQSEMKRRGDIRGYSESNQGRYSSKYPFSKKIVCGVCGTHYRRHAQFIRGEYTPTWVCATHKLKGSAACSQTYLREEEIERAFLEMIKSLVDDFQAVKTALRENIITSLDDTVAEDLDAILADIEQSQEEMLELVREKRAGNVTNEEYNQRGGEIEVKINELTRVKEGLEQRSYATKLTKKRVEEIIEMIECMDIANKFDGEIFKNIVDTVVVRNNYTLDFHLKVGLTESVTIVRH